MSGIECAFFGALGQDADTKLSKSGKTYLRLSVRTGNDDVQQWISVLAFDPSAVELADRFIKGARCYVEGTLRTSEWTAADGAKRFSLSVLAWHCRLAEIGRHRRKGQSRRRPKPSAGAGAAFFDDAIPF